MLPKVQNDLMSLSFESDHEQYMKQKQKETLAEIPCTQPILDYSDRRNEINFYECRNELSESNTPMHGEDRYLALDCEMVGVGPNGAYSALARVSIVNWWGSVVLDTFVKVPQRVTDFRTFVSGIRAKDIASKQAMQLDDCRNLVRKILRGKILVGHGLENDLKVLKVKHPWCDVRDTATYPPFMRESIDSKGVRQLYPKKLRDLTWEESGKVIQVLGKAHNPTEDAVAALELYKKVRNDWDQSIMWQIQMTWSKHMEVNRLQMTTSCNNSASSPNLYPRKPYYSANNVNIGVRSDRSTQSAHKIKKPKHAANNNSPYRSKAKHFQTINGIQYFRSKSGVIRSSSPENYEPRTSTATRKPLSERCEPSPHKNHDCVSGMILNTSITTPAGDFR